MKKLIMLIGAATVAVGAFADASTPPSTLVDLTTNGSNPSGSVDEYSSAIYSSSGYNATKAFDGVRVVEADRNSRWLPKPTGDMWFIYAFNVPTVVDSIRIYLPIQVSNDLKQAARAPKKWTFQGSNDKSTWVVLDTQTNETSWAKGESRYYKFSNTTAYKYYKFNCTANNGNSDCMQVDEIEFYCVGTAANSTWTGEGTTDLLSDVANWGGTSMPGSGGYTALIGNTGSKPAVVPGGLTVYYQFQVGNGSGNSAKVVQTNGTMRLLHTGTIGREGGVGEYSISGGEFVATNTTTYIGARTGKGTGVLDISGTADVKFNDIRMFYNVSAGSTARINVSENGTLSFTSMDLGYSSVNATGIVYQTGGTVKTGGYLGIGYNSKVVGVYEMTGGTCAIGGEVTAGRFGKGTLAVSGPGTVLTANTVRIGLTSGTNKGTGTLVVTNGGEVAATQFYAGAGASATNQATVTFNGGKLTAKAANDAFLKDFPNIQLEAGGLTIDTQGYALGISNCTFNVTGNGKITVVGGGTVTFANVTVYMSEKPSGAYVFAETDGTFSGVPTLDGIKGVKIELSNDLKRVVVTSKGFIIAVF